MKKFRNVIASFIAVIAALVAVYVGVWTMFIGGIIQGIEGIKETPVNSMDIAFGVTRVIFAGLVAYLVIAVGLIIADLTRTGKRKIRHSKLRKK